MKRLTVFYLLNFHIFMLAQAQTGYFENAAKTHGGVVKVDVNSVERHSDSYVLDGVRFQWMYIEYSNEVPNLYLSIGNCSPSDRSIGHLVSRTNEYKGRGGFGKSVVREYSSGNRHTAMSRTYSGRREGMALDYACWYKDGRKRGVPAPNFEVPPEGSVRLLCRYGVVPEALNMQDVIYLHELNEMVFLNGTLVGDSWISESEIRFVVPHIDGSGSRTYGVNRETGDFFVWHESVDQDFVLKGLCEVSQGRKF